MYRVFLSMRYLRSRPTNWIGVAGIFVAVTALILILSIMSGFLAESRRHLRGDLAELIIQPFFDAKVETTGVPPPRDPDSLLELVRAEPRVEAAAAQFIWVGMIVPPRREAHMTDPGGTKIVLVSFVGIDPEDQYRVSNLAQSLTEIPLVGPSDQRPADLTDPFAPPTGYEPDGGPVPGAILGEQLAAHWGLRKGDEIRLVTGILDPDTGDFKSPASKSFVVAGTFRSKSNDLDLERVYMERRALANWLGRGGGYTQVAVKLRDYERESRAVIADMRSNLHEAGHLHSLFRAPWEIQTWEEQRSMMLAAIQNEKTLLGIMLSLVLVVAAFTIFAILSMMVTEKRRDIGILAALGATRAGILGLFVLISWWEALLGAGLGLLAGIWAAVNINAIEAALSDAFGVQIFNRDIYLFDHIPTVLEAGSIGLIVVGAIVMSLIAAAIPAIRAAQLDPVEALRYE